MTARAFCGNGGLNIFRAVDVRFVVMWRQIALVQASCPSRFPAIEET